MKNISSILIIFALFLTFSCKDSSSDKDADYAILFKDYILFKTENGHSVVDPIHIGLAQPLDQFEINQEISLDYLKISPKTSGKLYVENSSLLRFVPDSKLKPDTKYDLTLMLSKLYEDIDSKLKRFEFSFHTIKPDFKLNLLDLQSYSREIQYLSGSIESADVIERESLDGLVSVKQNGKNLKVKWDAATAEYSRWFSFTIDSIQRAADDTSIEIDWDGKQIGSDNKGKMDYEIAGYDNLKVVRAYSQMTPSSRLVLNFSDPLDPDQDLAGMVSIEDIDKGRYEVNGNILYVYTEENTQGEHSVTVHSGIKSIYGSKLKESFHSVIAFQQAKPEAQFISKGTILPGTHSTPIYFKTVNLSAVDVRIIKIYNNNILQFLQNNRLNNTDDYYLQAVGKRVAKKTIKFDESLVKTGLWQAHALNLSDMFKADPGAIYRLEISFDRTYSLYDCDEEITETDITAKAIKEEREEEREERYWDNEAYYYKSYTYDWRNSDNPCHDAYYSEDKTIISNFLSSNLGLIVKKGTDKSYNFFTTNLVTGEPEPNTTIQLYNFQQQLLETLSSGSNSSLKIKLDENAAFAIAKKGDNYAYLKLQDANALSLSKFDIGGAELQKGLKGFIYAERGVHRPGDSIHLTFVLDDSENPLPKDIPARLEVHNAEGKLVQRTISSSGKSDQESRSVNRFYYFPIETYPDDPTGNWSARISVGSVDFYKGLNVATVKPNRLKIKLDFNDEILFAGKEIKGNVNGAWLHGAIARNLKVETEVTISTASSPFSNFADYHFSDPVRRFYPQEFSFFKANLDDNGNYRFSRKIDIDRQAPGMLKATFLTKLFEGGGDFSIDVFSKDIAPYEYFTGIKSPPAHQYGSYLTNENVEFDVVTVNHEGKPAANRNLEVQVFKVRWSWWWNTSDEDLSSYENATAHIPVSNFTVKTGADGKGSFKIKVAEEDYGRYLIRVIDKNSGHATGRLAYFVRDWYGIGGDLDADAASVLIFSSDKDEYQVNETANITFPSAANQYALLSFETGTKVISSRWVKTDKDETTVKIPVTADMAPNVYVNITLLQAHERTKNDMPVRLYGVIPLKVQDPATILHPQIDMPAELKPEQSYTVKVSEKNKKEMTYSLAIVEEGLLDLTNFKTPPIHSSFYARQALGVRTFDLYDYVVGAYSGSVNNIYEIGGDDAAESGKKQKANRFKPVVKYLGPYHLKPGETQSHKVQMPNYVGSVRAMVVAGDVDKQAYGNAEKTVPVKKPLMVIASLPRKLSPGETVTLPVTVFAMESKIKNVTINVKTEDGLEALDGNSKTLEFSRPDEKIVNFRYKVKETEKIQHLTVEVSGNGEKASYEVEFDIFNPNPISHILTSYEIDKGSNRTISYEPYGEQGTAVAKITLSTVPPMNLTRRVQYLIQYPHGCVEQTTSSVFPQLFLPEITDLPTDRKYEMEQNIKSAIKKLGQAQLVSGAFPFWPSGSQANSWATTYAGHFLIEAQKKGYSMPINFLNNWVSYQKNEARQWTSRSGYGSSFDQAYRLYTLALAGQAELSAMNRLRNTENLNTNARLRLAAAYALVGKKDIATEIMNKGGTNYNYSDNDYYTYGSTFRNQAMALETMVITGTGNQRELAETIAAKLSSDDWLSTQETSYSLLAMAKMVEANGGSRLNVDLVQNGKTTAVSSNKTIAERALTISSSTESITINNKEDNLVYATIYQEGKLPLGSEKPSASKLSVKTEFLDTEGNAVNVSSLLQGTQILAKITVNNTSTEIARDLTLAQIFPSGWEIINTSFTELGGGASGNANYIDIRDDRVYFHFDLRGRTQVTFEVKLNASYLGRYYLPGSNVQAMYDISYYAQDKGQWVEIHE